jgi:leucyl aminopeptidase
VPTKIIQRANPLSTLTKTMSHVLVVLPKGKTINAEAPGASNLEATLQRRRMKPQELGATPICGEIGQGLLVAWVMVDSHKTAFEQHSALRQALQLLLVEHPKAIDITVLGTQGERESAARLAVYVALVNGQPLPSRKKKNDARPLGQITVHGVQVADAFVVEQARAEGNLLCRELTALPPNELTPKYYRAEIARLAKDMGWTREEYDFKRLVKMGAGAFVAVAQGSSQQDAAIVHVSYRHRQAKRTVALVGKGICFDTGGHNLKPAGSMLGMHHDMNGSAVVLGIMLAATRLKLPVNIDSWLAIAQNHISPTAYKQNDVVTALNGTTIEVIHTDAEGRMVLADALTLAARAKPEMIVDFATLTGSMVHALGDRYSGVFSNRKDLLKQVIEAGAASGERVNPFPLDADYELALKSEIADTKQCLIAGEADHILAARFLLKFVNDLPWTHVDLAAANCEGGLGATATRITGFGVGLGLALLRAS